jgi:hypothetical protein
VGSAARYSASTDSRSSSTPISVPLAPFWSRSFADRAGTIRQAM